MTAYSLSARADRHSDARCGAADAICRTRCRSGRWCSAIVGRASAGGESGEMFVTWTDARRPLEVGDEV